MSFSFSARRLFTGIAALGLASVLLTACGDDSSSGPMGDNDNALYVSKQALIDTGTVVFEGSCSGCHGPAGNGQGHGAPVLANSDYVMGSKERLIRTVLQGVNEPIVVNGQEYAGGGMPAWQDMLTNHEIAGVLTYIRAVLNDSLVSNCVANPNDEFDITCTKTARNPADIASDSVAVWEVKAVSDTLTAI